MADLGLSAPSILTVDAGTLQTLSSREAVRVFRELLWAEARRLGLPPSAVTINETVEIADGGIDAQLSADGVPAAAGALVAGSTWFQIKAGGAFKPWQMSAIRSELLKGRAPSPVALGAEVRRCLGAGGRYTLVSFGHDLTPKRKADSEEHLQSVFSECGFPSARVEAWGSGHLRGFLHQYPSICLGLLGRGELPFQTLSDWAQNVDMACTYLPGPDHTRHIEEVRSALRGNVGHVRLVGEPGLGKTRFALEALRAADLAPLVLYCEHAERFRSGPLVHEVLRTDNTFHAIVVVDDCSFATLAPIWNLIRPLTGRIRLLTITHDPDPSSLDTRILSLPFPALPQEQIEGILRSHGVSAAITYHWARLCEGSPRVAQVIGANLRENPGDVLAPPSHSNVWERFVVGGDDRGSVAVAQRWVVLRYAALFQRFGFEQPVAQEGEAIATLVQEADRSITRPGFCAIIRELRERRILQGAATLRIVPKALHVWLWLEWWRLYAPTFQLEWLERLPGALPAWLHDMFSYGASSPAAREQARTLLESERFIDGAALRSKAGASLFGALALADPEAGVRCLERTLGRWSDADVQSFFTGRREVVNALECIVVWEACFQRGARLLLRLAEWENEAWSNNAMGVFTELFSPVPGRVVTEAPPRERLPVLASALRSGSARVREVALAGCRIALDRDGGSRTCGPEHQGLRSVRSWCPKTDGELFDAYRQAWALVVAAWRPWSGEERRRAGALLIEVGASFLEPQGFLFSEVLETFSELALHAEHHRELLSALLRALDRRAVCLELYETQRLQALHDRIVGSSLPDRVRRHVGMNLHEDHPVDVDWPESNRRVTETLRELATECLAAPGELAALLPWLNSRAPERALWFAIEVASLPEGLAVLPQAIEVLGDIQRDERGLDFLTGLFRLLGQRDVSAWEALLDELVAHPLRREWVAELTAGSGVLTVRAAERIRRLAAEGALPVLELERWCRGPSFPALPEDAALGWVSVALASDEERASLVAANLMGSYYCRNHACGSGTTPPRDLTSRVLLQALPVAPSPGAVQEHEWAQLAERYLAAYPSEGPEFLEQCLRRCVDEDRRFSLHGRPGAVLRSLFHENPTHCWPRLEPFLEARETRHLVMRWLAGDRLAVRPPGPESLPFMPADLIWPWVGRDPAERAPFVARYAPKTFDGPCGDLTRTLLVRHGRLDRVQDELHCNFDSGMWTGSESDHYRACAEQARAWRNSETHPDVIRWLDERAETCAARATRYAIAEERHLT